MRQEVWRNIQIAVEKKAGEGVVGPLKGRKQGATKEYKGQQSDRR